MQLGIFHLLIFRFLPLSPIGLSHKNTQFDGRASAGSDARLRSHQEQRECDTHDTQISSEAQYVRREI